MSKKNLILGGILVLLIIFVVLVNGPLEKIKYSMFGPKNFLAKVVVDDIERMDIIMNGKDVSIVKKENGWKVDGTKDFYVKKDISDSIAKALSELKGARFYTVSDNNDKKIDFKTDDSGIKIGLSGEKVKLVEFIIGKLTPDFESTYVSTFGSPETYSVTSDLFTPFNQAEWRDMTVFSSGKEAINKIRFQYPNREFTVVKEGEEWKGATPYLFSVNQEKIEKVLSIMTSLEASAIPTQSFEGTGLEKNLIIIEASGDGVNNTIMIGETNEEGMYFAKKSSSDNIYLVSSNIEIELDKRISQLR